MTDPMKEALRAFCDAMERDGDPAYAHLIRNGRAALTAPQPDTQPAEFARLLREEAAAMRREGEGCTDGRYEWMAAGIEAASDTLLGIDSATGKPVTPEALAKMVAASPPQPEAAQSSQIALVSAAIESGNLDAICKHCGGVDGHWQGCVASPPEAAAVPVAWISVEDRLPEVDSGEVLVWLTGGRCAFDEWHTHREDPTGMGGPTMDMGAMWRDYEYEEITHWMPLPAPPHQAQGEQT